MDIAEVDEGSSRERKRLWPEVAKRMLLKETRSETRERTVDCSKNPLKIVVGECDSVSDPVLHVGSGTTELALPDRERGYLSLTGESPLDRFPHVHSYGEAEGRTPTKECYAHSRIPNGEHQRGD